MSYFSIQDLYFYLSEEEKMKHFNESNLIWKKNSIEYGSWSGGEDDTGTYSKSCNIKISEVLSHNKQSFHFNKFYTKISNLNSNRFLFNKFSSHHPNNFFVMFPFIINNKPPTTFNRMSKIMVHCTCMYIS